MTLTLGTDTFYMVQRIKMAYSNQLANVSFNSLFLQNSGGTTVLDLSFNTNLTSALGRYRGDYKAGQDIYLQTYDEVTPATWNRLYYQLQFIGADFGAFVYPPELRKSV
jgi:hypothetical protein